MRDSSPNDYDTLPYEGHPDPLIHPDRMAAVAWLYGVESPPLDAARILEIGCATGAHLIPMAYQFPQAAFFGFDFSATQIALASAAAEAVGLKNCRFEVRDIRSPTQTIGEFDYIFAHGVFSWLPPTVQDQLLEICRRHLAPNGVALIDYNVDPGWHLRAFLRDLMRYHQQDQPNLQTATDAALHSLDYVAGHLFAPANSFGQSVGRLVQWAKAQPPNYLAHEFGGAAGHPMLFQDFAEKAQGQRLQILGDAEITHVIPAQHAASLATQLQEVAGSGYVRREQYLDFLRGREFRRTLLVHDQVRVSRQICTDAMQRLRFTTVARREAAPQGAVFRSPDGALLHTVNSPLIGALGALCKQGPAGLSFDEMYRLGCANAPATSTIRVATFAESLLEVAAGGLILLHTCRPKAVNYVSEKPLANALARTAANMGRDVVTSMLQRDWRIDSFERLLLGLLDGGHDRPALRAELLRHVERGELADGAPQSRSGDNLLQFVDAHLTTSLEWFVRAGLLIS